MKHDVGTLDVPVKHPRRVGCRQRREELAHIVDDLVLLRQNAQILVALDLLLQRRAAAHQLHRDIGAFTGGRIQRAEAIDLNEMALDLDGGV